MNLTMALIKADIVINTLTKTLVEIEKWYDELYEAGIRKG